MPRIKAPVRHGRYRLGSRTARVSVHRRHLTMAQVEHGAADLSLGRTTDALTSSPPVLPLLLPFAIPLRETCAARFKVKGFESEIFKWNHGYSAL